MASKDLATQETEDKRNGEGNGNGNGNGNGDLESSLVNSVLRLEEIDRNLYR